jgi:RNase P protein component
LSINFGKENNKVRLALFFLLKKKNILSAYYRNVSITTHKNAMQPMNQGHKIVVILSQSHRLIFTHNLNLELNENWKNQKGTSAAEKKSHYCF